MRRPKKKKPEPSPANRRATGERNLAKGAPYRWQPGTSGNPSGRPRTAALSVACREKLEQIVPDDPHKRTYAVLIADMLADKAAHGNLDAAAELADRAEGKARQRVDFGEDADDPLLQLIEQFDIAHQDHLREQQDKAKEEESIQ